MPNITITQLPAAGPITGTESVPIVQNGQTLRTTTAALAGSPVQTQTFLTVNQEPTLNNSRALAGGTGIGLVDGGAQSTLQVTLNGASGSLEAASNGVIVKTGASAVTNRSIAVSGTGLSIANGSGVSGNPTVALDGLISAIAQVGGTGLLAFQNGATAGGVLIAGTANQISVANGNGQGGNPTISMVSDPIIPGTAGMIIPVGTAAQEPIGAQGQFRFNSTSQTFDGYAAGQWRQFSQAVGVTTFSAGSTGLTPSSATTGAITLGGTLNVSSGGTGANTLTGYLVGNGTAAVTAVATIPNAGLTNSSITINGSPVSLGGSITVTAALTNALTIGTGLSGGSFNGSSAVTIAIDSTVATLTGTQTLTNKSISGATNTLTNIPNGALTNSSLTIGTTAISLGASSLTLGGLTSVAVTQDPTSALQLATKQYVDSVAEGLHVHASCAAATPNTLASLTGGTVTYNNGTAGVGATLTLSVALTTLDGYTLQNGDRVLVKNEATQANNGIYTWATGGTVLTRATDFDTAIEIASGDFTFITNGTLYAGTGWVQTQSVTTIGTDAIIWQQFSGAGTYTAGTGLTLTGTQFSITNTSVVANTYGSASAVPVFAVNAQGQITGVTNTNIAISGSAVSGDISGNAANVTGVVAVANGGTGLTSGTSGGVLYYSATGTLASSAALAANSIVLGGGAGAAPATTTTGTGVVTALGSNINTTGGLVTQSGALAASALLLGGGSGSAITSTTTGTGVVTALGNNANSTGGFATINGIATFTNKRFDPRVSSTTSTASITPDISSFDQYAVTAQAATLTINAPTGTPVDGNKLIFRILDNGVAQTLSWNGTYTVIGVTLPTTTTAGKMTYVGCIYNAANTRWDVIAVTTQA